MRLPLLSGGVAAVASLFLLRPGIRLSPDGWAYWQGSLSLLTGRGYTYLDGAPILQWPPLYSLYLAAWQAVAGVSALTLVVSTVAAVSLAAAAWTFLYTTVWGEAGDGDAPGPAGLILPVIAVFLGLQVATRGTFLLADLLKDALVPVLLVLMWCGGRTEERRHHRLFLFAAGLAGAALMLSHNTGIVFVLASLPAGWRAGRGAWKRRVRDGAAVLLLAVAPWLVVRTALGQWGGHDIGIGAGRWSPRAYAELLLHELPIELLPPQLVPHAEMAMFRFVPLLALLLLAIWAARGTRAEDEAARTLLSFWAVATAGLLVLFNLVRVHDPLAGRFLSFWPLTLIPVGLLLLARRLPGWTLPALVVLALAKPVGGLLAARQQIGTASDRVAPRQTIAREQPFLTIVPQRSLEVVEPPPRPGAVPGNGVQR